MTSKKKYVFLKFTVLGFSFLLFIISLINFFSYPLEVATPSGSSIHFYTILELGFALYLFLIVIFMHIIQDSIINRKD